MVCDYVIGTNRVCISDHSWQRGPNPIFYEETPIAYPPFSNFVQPPLPPFPFRSNPHPHCYSPSVVLFLWLNVLSRHIWCAILLNDIMDLQMSSLGILVPEGP